MARTVFHMTRDPAAILAAGFIDGDGGDGLGVGDRLGVSLTAVPAMSSAAALVLAVELPDNVDLAEYELEPGSGQWCVPAEVINPAATVRLMSQAEVDESVAEAEADHV